MGNCIQEPFCFTETGHTRKRKVKQGEQKPPSHTFHLFTDRSDTVEKKNMLNCSVLREAPICASLTRYWFAALTDYRQTKGDRFTWKSASAEKEAPHFLQINISEEKVQSLGEFQWNTLVLTGTGDHITQSNSWAYCSFWPLLHHRSSTDMQHAAKPEGNWSGAFLV